MKTSQNVSKTIDNYFRIWNSEIEKMEIKMKENFVYYFAWAGEDLFNLNHKRNLLKELVNPNQYDYDVELMIKDLSRFVSQSYNVRENSSGALHREASTFKFVATMEFIDILKNIVKQYPTGINI